MARTEAAPVLPRAAPRFQYWKRRRFWLLAVVLLLTAVVVSLPFLPIIFGARLKVENFDEIQLGMAQSEVESLLGGAPGYYRRPPAKFKNIGSISSGPAYFAPAWTSDRWELWVADDTSITVYFDNNGRVSHKEKDPEPRTTSKDWAVYFKDWYKDWFERHVPGSKELMRFFSDLAPDRYRAG
jgi:hypothetical protein